MNYIKSTGVDRPDMIDIQAQIEWPEFILHDLNGETYWEELFVKFPTYQFALFNGEEMVGCANSIPLCMDDDVIEYNNRGWDWALEKGFRDLELGKSPNLLCGLQIGINGKYKGNGISSLLIQGMKQIAIDKNFKAVILPIRPMLKSKYPLVEMKDYVNWINKDGLPYDPWIRAHAKCGASIVSVCEESMFIPGTVKEWESWTGMSFQSSGKYVIPGALSPVDVSLIDDKIVYLEPNVWMIHNLK